MTTPANGSIVNYHFYNAASDLVTRPAIVVAARTFGDVRLELNVQVLLSDDMHTLQTGGPPDTVMQKSMVRECDPLTPVANSWSRVA